VVVRAAPCTPTQVGATIYRHALQVELLEKDLLGAVAPTKAVAAAKFQTPMTVAVNADSLATWLMPAIARFVAETDLQVEIVVDDQDHTAEWLRSGRVLGAVTGEARPVQGCRSRPLGVMRYRATASPAFVRRWFPKGATAEALRHAPALIFNRKDELHERFVRKALGGRAGQLRTHMVPSSNAFVEACVLGLGWGLNPERLADSHLRGKRLVELVADKWLDVPLYWQHWGLASESLDALTRALEAQAATALRRP
jgi:LysR family transcriptional regulator, chromosome initiation inhibitor